MKPGELRHPLACRAGDPARNRVLKNSWLPRAKKSEDMLRARSVSSTRVSSTISCLDMQLQDLGIHQ